MNTHAFRVLEWPPIVEALAECAASSLGRSRALALEIMTDVAEISRALRVTSEARDLLRLTQRFPLGGIHDVRPALRRARQEALLSAPELIDVADTLFGAKTLKGFINQHAEDFETLAELAEPLDPLESVATEIRRCFDPSGEVADAASPDLARVRQKIKHSYSHVHERLQAMIRGQASALQEPIVTLRRDRFVLPVRADSKSSIPGIVHDQSASGVTLYIEPLAVVELNNALAQARAQESQEIEKVIQRLSELVTKHVDAIEITVDALAEIDFAYAKAGFSLKLDAYAPRLDESGHTKLYKARHPMLALAGHVVPIDIEIGGKFSTLLVTGPNTGGKTVSLKTLGLVTLMTQAGLHVPVAQGSQVGIFTSIYADIGDEQSIAQSLSTFSGHMRNIIRILTSVDHRSLVLLDEVGAGTDPSEGAVLARTILEELQSLGAKTVATTHYGELKLLAFSLPGFENSSVEFDEATLSPTYHLLMGVPGQSNAISISQRLGLPENVANRARELIQQGSSDSAKLIRQLEEDRAAAILSRREAEEALAHAQKMEAEYEAKLDTWRLERNAIREKAAKELSAELKEAKAEIANVIRELQNSRSGQAAQKAQGKLAHIHAQMNKTERDRHEKREKARELGIGDRVFVEKLGTTAEIVSLPDSNGNLTVAVGPMRVGVKLSELGVATKAEKKEAKKDAKRAIASKVQIRTERQASLECDVRGMVTEDAIFEVEQFLDTAYGAEVKNVCIIHGAGTGMLRKKIREYLRESPYIADFRPGELGEGGDGVTVATLA